MIREYYRDIMTLFGWPVGWAVILMLPILLPLVWWDEHITQPRYQRKMGRLARIDPGELTDSDILELAGRAVTQVRALPAGYRVDPGAGSGSDRLQFNEPSITQCCDMARRGGSYETLYTGSSIERIVIHVVRAAIARIEARQGGDGTAPREAREPEKLQKDHPHAS